MQSKPKPNNPRSFYQYAGMGFQILATIGIFSVLGIFADKQIGLKIPIFTIVLSLAGVILAMYSIIRKL